MRTRALAAALLSLTFALGALVSTSACRSAARETIPQVALAPAAAATPLPTPTPAPVVRETPKPATPVAAGANAAAPATPSATAGGNGEGDPAAALTAEEENGSGPAAAQKEALDLCQSASDQLERGERETAIAALDRAYELMTALPANGDGSYVQAKEDIRLLVAELIQRAYKPATVTRPASRPWDLALPLVDNEHVRREIESFTTVERPVFLEAYRRSGHYRPMILAKLEAAGLPSQLSWLPLVESAFKVRALSRASALGLWQFIASTGQRYGLSRDGWIDERLDPVKSTDAAIAYLGDLHGVLGDWPKALAAYNCGEARVIRTQRRTADQYQDFWDLYEELPRETRRYVPRLLAALLILESPEKYGMTLPEPEAPVTGLARVSLARAVSLTKLDEALGLEPGVLATLNPELRASATPPRTYDLVVPAERVDAVAPAVAQLPEWKRPAPDYHSHRVRSGETLASIARRYGTTVAALQRANGLKSVRLLRIGQTLRIPGRGAR